MIKEKKQFRYIALKADFEEQISSGKRPSGSLFPTEREIQQYGSGYSRNTVRMMIKTLLSEGFLRRMNDRRLVVWDNRLSTAKVKFAFFSAKQLDSLNDILSLLSPCLADPMQFSEHSVLLIEFPSAGR